MATLKQQMTQRWSVGIDPGFRCTGVVLLQDGIPVAAAAAKNEDTGKPIQWRTWTMARWLQETLQAWITDREIKRLDVIMELPFLKTGERGVVTLMTQMRMAAAYEDAIMRLEDCDVRLGEVQNSTAKMVFAQHGNANKSDMIAISVWRNRPDVRMREHLADAQGIGSCYPAMIQMNSADLFPVPSLYVDNAIGEGPQWKDKR